MEYYYTHTILKSAMLSPLQLNSVSFCCKGFLLLRSVERVKKSSQLNYSLNLKNIQFEL